MTTEEFSNEFDALLNSYSNIEEFGKTSNNIVLDEYEKSVFLTKAQESLVINIYSGKGPIGGPFENTEEARRYLSPLVKTYKTSQKDQTATGISNKSTFFKFPEDLWFIVYEAVNFNDKKLGCKSSENICVVPITLDEYHRISRNPFRGANDRRVLRLDTNNDIVELISEYNIQDYIVRYLSKPSPIILNDLPDNLTINKLSTKTECMLSSALHRPILEYAVKLALMSKLSNATK